MALLQIRNSMWEERTMKDKDTKLELKTPTIHQKNENCQVFNGPISGCVFAMPGSTVNQSPVQKVDTAKLEKRHTTASDIQEQDKEHFRFIHPEIDDEEAWRIHRAIKRLVANYRVPEICNYLKEQKQNGKLMLPLNPSGLYSELVRLGMPNDEGFSEKYFSNIYNSYMK